MTQQVMNDVDGEIAEVLCHREGLYWLRDPKRPNLQPWTSPVSLWGPVKPKAGDVWKYKTSDYEYRVLGVDETNRVYLFVRKEDYADGEWLVPNPALHQREADAEAFGAVMVRSYPDSSMELVSRL